LIRRQLGDGFGDFFDFHVAHYSMCLSHGKGLAPPWRPYGLCQVSASRQPLVES
jgi:hypothetical protein